MKRRTLAILLAVLAVLAAVWLANSFGEGAAQNQQAAQPALNGFPISPQGDTDLQTAQSDPAIVTPRATQAEPDEHGAYTTKEDVALYLSIYGRLPENFITKSEARALGWSGGGLDDYDYGKCIGGDRFGNSEGLLPQTGGRIYYECDVDTLHRDERGAKRIVYSDDGLIYYTGDHYESFELLYGEP